MNWLKTLLWMIAVLGPVAWCAGAASPTAKWLSGSRFEDKLASPVSVLWADNTLRQSLLDFGRAQQIAVYLDRRIDPGGKLDLAARNMPIGEILREVARQRNLGVSILGDVVFISLPHSARRVATVAELRCQDLQNLGKASARKFAAEERFAWSDFATPREILQQLAESHGLEVVNLEQIPHDLWPAANLPPMTLVDRLTLVLEQFDMTFQVAADGRRIAAVPVPADVAIVRDYPGQAQPQELLAAWRQLAPDCQFRVVGSRIYVKGLIEDHERIEAAQGKTQARPPADRARRPGPAAPPEQVFTAKNANVPLGAVLSAFARQLGLELQIDLEKMRQAGISLDQLISFEVEQASFDELLDAVLKPVGCTHQRRGNVLVVQPAS